MRESSADLSGGVKDHWRGLVGPFGWKHSHLSHCRRSFLAVPINVFEYLNCFRGEQWAVLDAVDDWGRIPVSASLLRFAMYITS